MDLVWMIVFSFLGILFSVESAPDVFSDASAPKFCGNRTAKNTHDYVIAGADAKRGDWPWQVILMSKAKLGYSFCGGTLINDQWVVSAAHCFDQSVVPTIYTVGLGYTNRKDMREQHRVDLKVARMIMHPGWDPNTINNDIALLQLEKKVSFNRYVSPACLPSTANVTGENCFITGWGKMRADGWMVTKLQEAEMEVKSNHECQQRLNGDWKPITDAMLCAGDAGKTKRMGCQGDSGGPFVCKIGNSWELHGIVSWGSATCSSTNMYTVFARVHYFNKWIQSTIKMFPSAPTPKHNERCSKFEIGDGESTGGEIHVKGLFPYSSCIDECYKRSLEDPRINGVNVGTGVYPTCYCEIGMTSIDFRYRNYKTCWLNSAPGSTPPQPPATTVIPKKVNTTKQPLPPAIGYFCKEFVIGDGVGGEGEVASGTATSYLECIQGCYNMSRDFYPNINGARIRADGACFCEIGMTAIGASPKHMYESTVCWLHESSAAKLPTIPVNNVTGCANKAGDAMCKQAANRLTCRLPHIKMFCTKECGICDPFAKLCSNFTYGKAFGGAASIIFDGSYTFKQCIQKCYLFSQVSSLVNGVSIDSYLSQCTCEMGMWVIDEYRTDSIICMLTDGKLRPTPPPRPEPEKLCSEYHGGDGTGGEAEIRLEGYFTETECIETCRNISRNVYYKVNGVRRLYEYLCICEVGMAMIDGRSANDSRTCWLKDGAGPQSPSPPVNMTGCTNIQDDGYCRIESIIDCKSKRSMSLCAKACGVCDYTGYLCTDLQVGRGADVTAEVYLEGSYSGPGCIRKCFQLANSMPSGINGARIPIGTSKCICLVGMTGIDTSVWHSKTCMLSDSQTSTTSPPYVTTTNSKELCGAFQRGDGKGGIGEIRLDGFFSESTQCIHVCHNISKYAPVNGARFYGGFYCACELGMTRIEYSHDSKTCMLQNTRLPETPIPLPEGRNKTGCFNMIGDYTCSNRHPSACQSTEMRVVCAKYCGTCGSSEKLCGSFKTGNGDGDAEVVLDGNYTEQECIKTCYILSLKQSANINGVRIPYSGSQCICEVGMTWINEYVYDSKTCWLSGATKPTTRPTAPTYWRTRWPPHSTWHPHTKRSVVVDFFLKLIGNVTVH